MPEAVCIAASRYGQHQMQLKFGFNLITEYFERQRHSDLPSFVEGLFKDSSTANGAQVMVMTFSPIRGKIGQDLKKTAKVASVDEVSLHELSSSQDIEKVVNDFHMASTQRKGVRFLLIHADPVAASLRMIEHCRFICEKSRIADEKARGGSAGGVFVILIVHLQRGIARNFSFDFDSRWHFVFLDSVEPALELSAMPSLGQMLNMSLLDVVSGLDFGVLLKQCFRSALSRLIDPHSRNSEYVQRQIQQMLVYLEDGPFVGMARDWVLRVLKETPKNPEDEKEGSVGQDTHWFAAIASAAHELALAGTFRAALHNRIVVLVTSLFTALLAHLDRNGGLVLLSETSKRELWLKLATASLSSSLSMRLHKEAVSAITETATAQHEVGTDAQTGARPFASRMPSSWFVSRTIGQLRHVIETLPPQEQLSALYNQYHRLTKLHEVGLDPALTPALLDDYLADFTAMHLDWTSRLDRSTQQRILKKTLQRIKGKKLESILEVHQLFWNAEKRIAYCISLLNAVPAAVLDAEKLIDAAELSTLNLELLLLVHGTLVKELKDCDPQNPAPHNFYRDWLTRKTVVSGLTKDYLANFGSQKNERLQKLKAESEPRVETLALFLQHVAYPLQLKPSIVKQLLDDLPSGAIRHSTTLLAMLKVSEKMTETACGEQAFQALGTFIESWMLDVCLRDAETTSNSHEHLLSLFCSLAGGLPVQVEHRTTGGIVSGDMERWRDQVECGIAILPSKKFTLPRSSCLNLALLRKLLVRSDGESKQRAVKKIEELLKQVSAHEEHDDTTFATKYAVLCEESAAMQLQKCFSPVEWPDMSLTEVFRKDRVGFPATMLQDVGHVRWMLSQYAQVLCQDPIDVRLHDIMVSKVDPLLATDHQHLVAVCRSMRLYLLKCVERRQGVTVLRGLLSEAPLCHTNWVKKWRILVDIDFEKFIGAALVPKWNPFTDDADGQYAKAKIAVLDMMNSENTESLDKFAKECAKRDVAQQRRDIGGLLLALCQEPGLLAALEEEGRRPQWRKKLNDWLAHNKELPVNDKERMLLRLFAGDHTPIIAIRTPDSNSLESFSVANGRKMEELLRWRVLGHLASVLIAAPPTSLLSFLRKLMLEPAALTAGEIPFMPGMDEDIRNRVMKALLERGENIWKFKSHWYKCTQCGYTFFIGECGRPMEVSSCPNCKAQIGGRDHTKTAQTQEDDETDRSPNGYMLPSADKDEKHVSFREVPSSSARAVRLLLHGAMFCGVAAHIPHVQEPSRHSVQMPRIYSDLVNTDSMCTMNKDCEAKYLGDHFLNDWKHMVSILSSNGEDLAAALHFLLRDMSVNGVDDPRGQTGSQRSWEKLTLQARNSWEETIEAKYLFNMIKNYDNRLQELYRRWGGAEEDGKFVAELKESADVREFPTPKRASEMPQLWAYRSAVTLDALHARVGVERQAMETLPVLCTVLQQPLYPVLKALGTLVGVFEWHSLVNNHFSGRITRSEAAKLKVGDFIDGLPPAEQRTWERAYRQFQRAWHTAWPYTERHECLQLSEKLKQVMISRDSSISWCIADADNEGICPLALTEFLVERHNELVQVVSTAIGYPARKVSSRLLDHHDVIHYDGEALMHFLRSRCVTYGVGGKLNFDLKQLENHLRRELTRPEITMELRAFHWLGESFVSTVELKSVINQRELPAETVERLRLELASAAVAHACLQKVQMSISFILKSGGGLSGEHAGDMVLSEYLRTVLSESSDCLPSSAARGEVQLRHVDAFARLLKQMINKDPTEGVEPRYKVDLTKELLDAITKERTVLPSTLVDIFGNFAEAQLTKAYLDPEERVTVMLSAGLLEVGEDTGLTQEQKDVIISSLPRDLQMKHWVATYRLLKSTRE
uniref:RZ-type domain-containing protein n=1 Tax=Noctiluca scintillans TaxID=2966 RepID=A0A7S1FB82_NOCSC